MAKTVKETAEQKQQKVLDQLREADKKNQLLLQSKRARMQELLNSYKTDFASILPQNFPVERLISAAMACMARQPDLLDCSPSSIISSITTAGSLGLMPDGVLGECYLQASSGPSGMLYCEFMIGYKGLIALANRSGQVQTIQAKEVYRANDDNGMGDELEYEHGLRDIFRHKGSGNYYLAADVSHFWVKVVLMNGGILWDVWTRRQVEAIRDETKSYKDAKKKEDTYWGRYFVAMACSKLLRAILKTVTLSPDLGRAIKLDEMADAGVRQNTEADFIDDFTNPDFQEDVYLDITERQYKEELEKKEKANVASKNKGNAAVAATHELLKNKGNGK